MRIALALPVRLMMAGPLLLVALGALLSTFAVVPQFSANPFLAFGVPMALFGLASSVLLYLGYVFFFWSLREARLFIITTLERLLETSEHLVRDD